MASASEKWFIPKSIQCYFPSDKSDAVIFDASTGDTRFLIGLNELLHELLMLNEFSQARLVERIDSQGHDGKSIFDSMIKQKLIQKIT
ncbi:MAG: hypothetical protein V7752_18325 [Halopseudomonas sp.]